MNQEKFVEIFLETEYKNDFFSLDINGLKPWHYIRHEVADSILASYGICEIDNRIRFNEYNDRSWSQIKHQRFIGNQYYAERRDVLIIPHQRRFHSHKGYYKCLFTDQLSRSLKRSFYLLDLGDLYHGWLPMDFKEVLFWDFDDYIKKNNLKPDDQLPLNESTFENRFVNPLKEAFCSCTIDNKYVDSWKEKTYWCLAMHDLYRSYYEFLLDKIQPKTIIIMVYYGYTWMVLCEVAKDRRIPVIELQHGQVNRNVIDYNFLGNDLMPAFPDYFFSFGELEKEARMPIPKSHIISVGFPELECNSVKKAERNKRKTILFISSMKKELAKCAYQLAEILNSDQYHVIFKCHPKEVDSWRQDYGMYLENSVIEVADTMECTVHDYMSISDWVIGVSSSALYEATVFNVKIGILKISDYDYVKTLYESGEAKLFADVRELYETIVQDSFHPSKQGHFYKKNSINNMISSIEYVIGNKIHGSKTIME